MFKERSTELERIDTGDYTREEYETFLREIAFINRHLGDARALERSLFRKIEHERLPEFSLLDVGCGSGELLKIIANFARGTDRRASLTGLDINPLSAAATHALSLELPEIKTVRGNAFNLPFDDQTFDFAISSLFFHHLTDQQIPAALREMSRVSRRGIFVIDLHRHPAAYVLYRLFCTAFRISPLVREDGSLSIKKGFKSDELAGLFAASGLQLEKVARAAPFRLVACGRERR